jgi:broad specificity phosphatase PhoE
MSTETSMDTEIANDNGNTGSSNVIRIIFVRHGETPAAIEGVIQGKSDDSVFNGLTEKGKGQIQKTAIAIKAKISSFGDDISPENIYLYAASLKRTEKSAQIIKKEDSILDENYFVTSQINGRDYGELEGFKESELREKKSFVLKAGKVFPYLFSQLGLEENGQGIETKQHFEARILSFVCEIMSKHKQSDVVIISANSDMWNMLRKSDELEPFCKFESKERLGCGEFTEIDVTVDEAAKLALSLAEEQSHKNGIGKKIVNAISLKKHNKNLDNQQ